MINVIASGAETESAVGDSMMLALLLASSVERGFTVKELPAGKAYLSNDNLTAIEAAGAAPYIPFKSNSRGTGKSDAWRRRWHTLEARNDELLARYHQRSNVESTFSMVKRKFGSSIRAKALAGPIDEVLLKCLCHTSRCSCTRSTSLESSPRSGRGWRPRSRARSALNPAEQEHVRALLRLLRVKLGGWPSVQRARPVSDNTLWRTGSGRTEVSATLAFRVAKLIDAPISAILTGAALPPGTCKRCGRANEE